MKKSTLLMLTSLLTSLCAFGQTTGEVIIPDFNDKYCNYIRQLEAGETDIDYQDFRFSFIESEQFKIAAIKSKVFDSLTKLMYANISDTDYQEVISITKQMLSINYTSMLAHKMLRQTYKIIGDTVNAAKYKTIQFGLLTSIVKKGDGKSCETGWPVIMVDEEYFILNVMGAKLQKQSLVTDGGICDKMEVKEDGEKKTYYFDVSKVFEGYKKME